MRRKIVFLAVNSSFSHTNLAALYLSARPPAGSGAGKQAQAADSGWQWETVELTVGDEVFPALDLVAGLQPDVLAASLYIFNRNSVLSFIRRYKSAFPRCKVVVGGPELLGDNRAFLTAETCIDAAIRGEGELPFRKLLACIDTPQRWPEIRGFCGMLDGTYHDNGMAEKIACLDDIPPPFTTGLSRSFKKPFIQLETSRGCRNKCSFCTSGGTGVRYFSLPRVRADLNAIRCAGIRNVRIVDRTFNDNMRRSVALLRMFRDKFDGMNFHLEVDPAKITRPILDEFAAAGPRRFHLDVGIQSFSPKVMKNTGRRGAAARSLAGLENLCALKNVDVHADLIAGLPGGTLDHVFDDLTRLVSLKPSEIQLELLKLLPGTRLSNEAAKRRIAASPEPPYEVLKTADMSAADVHTARWLSKLVDWFYGPEPLRATVQAANDTLPAFWRDLCALCRGRPGLWTQPSLINRFKMLYEFLGDRHVELRHGLQYAWMKHGFSARDGICSSRPWKGPLPAEAVLVEGDAGAGISNAYAVDLDRACIFAYGKGPNRRAVAVYAIGER